MFIPLTPFPPRVAPPIRLPSLTASPQVWGAAAFLPSDLEVAASPGVTSPETLHHPSLITLRPAHNFVNIPLIKLTTAFTYAMCYRRMQLLLYVTHCRDIHCELHSYLYVPLRKNKPLPQ